MKTADEMRRILADKAGEDEEFRNRLMADPKGVIEQEFDLEIPASLDIQVHEDSAETAHLVLPPSPKLSETQLDHVAGGLKSAQPRAVLLISGGSAERRSACARPDGSDPLTAKCVGGRARPRPVSGALSTLRIGA